MFRYLIHLLYLFYIKLFSQSETIFTNDEHKILSRLSFIFHYSIYLKDLIKSWVQEFKSQISMFFVTVYEKNTQSWMWILSCKHAPFFEMMCNLYFRRYKLFNYKYVHIVKQNVLRLNKDFFFSFLSWLYCSIIYGVLISGFGWNLSVRCATDC